MSTAPTFTPACSRNRLRFIQSLCHKRTTDPRAVQEKPSVVLVLPGEDGRYNAGSQALLKYLLLGACGTDLQESTVDYADQPLEDVALAITEDGVAVFRPSNLPAATSAIMNEWRNVRGYEVLEADTELREEVELYKIKSFIDMVDGHDYVGVALTGGWSRDDTAKPPTSYDQFEVESWPLVQAFGIADFGTGGFFTMKHRVLNVSQHLSSIYSHIDAHAVKELVGEVVPALERHWATSMQVLDVIRSRPRRLGIMEEVVADALVTHYEFGRLRSAKLPGRGARVLFGVRTNDQKATASTARVGTCGIGGSPALHMTLEAEDPEHGLRVARTYFFRGGSVANLPTPRRLVAEEATDAQSDVAGEAESKGSVAAGDGASQAELSVSERHEVEPGTKDARYLMALYNALLTSVKRAVAVLGECGTNLSSAGSKCLEAVFDVFAPPDSGEPLLPYEFDLGANLDVSVQFVDANGNTVDSTTASSGHRRLLVYIKVALLNVPSQETEGEVLGCVVAGDTALVGEGHAPCVLTGRIPPRAFWTTSEVEAAASSAIDRALSSQAFRAEVLGVGVPHGEPLHHAMVALSSPSWPVAIEGTLRLFDGGFALMTPRQAPLVVSIAAHVVAVRVVAAETAARCVGLALSGSAEADRASASWADGPPPTATRAEADSGDVLVLELNDTASFVPGSKFVGLVLSRGSGIKFAVVDMLSKWQQVISQREADAAVSARVATDAASDWEAQTRAAMGEDVAASPSGSTWSGSDLPPELYEGYRACAYRAWQWDFECRSLVEDILIADAFRGCAAKPETCEAATASSDISAEADAEEAGPATMPVVILTGAPGSGKSRVASALVGFSNDEYVWELVQQPLSSGITFDAVALQGDVTAALTRVAARATRDRPGCIAVVAAGYADVVAVASAITAVDGVHVAACVGCVHMLNLHRDERRTQWLPRMMEQFSRGWTTHAAFLGCEDVDVEELDRVKAVVRQCNPEVSILRLNGGLGRTITLSAGSISDIVKCTAFLKPSAVAFRNLACPGWHVAHSTAEYVASATSRQASVAEELERMGEAMQTRRKWRDSAAAIDGVQPLSPSIGAVHVTTGAVFVERRLRKVLSSLVRLAKDPVAFVLGITERTGDGELSLVDTDTSRDGLEVWRVKGFVRVVDPGHADKPARLVQVDAVPGVVRIHDVEGRQSVGASTTTSEILFVGQSLSRDKLTARIFRARPRRLALRQRRTVAALTAAEKAAIRKAKLNAPLPPGTWFDGHQYMDHTGIPTPDHPLLATFFEEYVACENAEVEAHNSAVEAQGRAATAEAAGAASASSWWVPNSDLVDEEDAAQQAVLRQLTHCIASDSDLEDLVPAPRAGTSVGVTPPTPPRPATASATRGAAAPPLPATKTRRRASDGQRAPAAPLPRVSYGRSRSPRVQDAGSGSEEEGFAESKGQGP